MGIVSCRSAPKAGLGCQHATLSGVYANVNVDVNVAALLNGRASVIGYWSEHDTSGEGYEWRRVRRLFSSPARVMVRSLADFFAGAR